MPKQVWTNFDKERICFLKLTNFVDYVDFTVLFQQQLLKVVKILSFQFYL